jgi:hypothetical protein
MTQSEAVTPAPAAQPRRRRSWFLWLVIILVVLIGILIIVNLGLRGLVQLDHPSQNPSGTLLYASSFDNAGDEWSQYQGQTSAKIENGSLHISIDAVNSGVFSVLSYDFGDFDARINASRVTANDQYNELGLLFRYRDPQNYYVLLIRGDGAYKVERNKDGQVTVLSEYHASPAVLPGLGVVNQLRVVGQGSHFKFYVNDQQLTLCPNGPGTAKSTWSGDQCMSNNGKTATELVDDSFDDGQIGAGVRVADPGIDVAFDNVTVYAP